MVRSWCFLPTPSFCVDLLDGLFPVLPSLFSVLDETRDHYTDACRYLSFHPATTPLQRTCMHTTNLLVSLGPRPPGPRCNFSIVSSSPFPSLFSVLCSPQSWVIIRVFGFACVRSLPLFLPVSVSHPRCFDEKPLKKELLYKCVLYPLALPFPLLFPSLGSSLFYL